MDKKIQPPLFQGGWFHVQHPPPDAPKLIEHAEKTTQEWIDSSMYLSGSLDALNDLETGNFIVTLGSDDEYETSSDDSADDDIDFNFTLEGDETGDTAGEDAADEAVADEDFGEDFKLSDLWVQCDNKTCKKWRLLEEPWKSNGFKCRRFSDLTCAVICDACELAPCMCRCDKCHTLLRVNPCSTSCT